MRIMNSSLYCFALLGLLIGTVWNDKKSENKSDFITLEQIPKCCPLDKVWDESSRNLECTYVGQVRRVDGLHLEDG